MTKTICGREIVARTGVSKGCAGPGPGPTNNGTMGTCWVLRWGVAQAARCTRRTACYGGQVGVCVCTRDALISPAIVRHMYALLSHVSEYQYQYQYQSQYQSVSSVFVGREKLSRSILLKSASRDHSFLRCLLACARERRSVFPSAQQVPSLPSTKSQPSSPPRLRGQVPFPSQQLSVRPKPACIVRQSLA